MITGLITWAYPPEKSGLSRAAREIAEALAEAGHTVRVLTMDRSGRGRVGPIEVIGCRGGPIPSRLRRLAGAGHLVAPMLFARAARAEHRRRPFDVIEATNWYAPGLVVAFAGPAPLVTRNSTPVAISAGPAATMRDRIDLATAARLERISARAGAGLISNTQAHGETIAALYGVPPPGPDHAVIGLSLPDAIVARGRAAYYPPPSLDGIPNLLFVGRAEARKGFAELLDAFAILTVEGVPFRATLIGIDEGDVATLPPAVRTRIALHHRVHEEGLHDALAAADVVLAPSRYESFGIVYQEAMAFGRPIVACAEDASARLFVGDTEAGVLAATCTGSGIADALRPLLADAALRARLAERSRRAGGRFTRVTLARETVAVYEAAIGGPR